MGNKLTNFIYARYRAFPWFAGFELPRDDVLRGWSRLRWLACQRRLGRLVDPSVRVQGNIRCINELLSIGKDAYLDRGCMLWIGGLGSISLADRCYVGPYAFLGTENHQLFVGEDTMIGAYSYLITENHCTNQMGVPYKQQGYHGADVIIGKNVWLGCHVTVLPGVTIGDNAIIGAGAVVTKSVPSNETWVGIPAKKLGQRTDISL